MITIPELKGKELFKFLQENKSALISQKKSMLKKTEPVFFSPSFIYSKPDATKADAGATEDTGTILVKVVANTAMFFDSQADVLLPDNAKKSIKDRKGLIPHIHDHIWEVTSEVGDVKNIYYQDVPLKELGVNQPGTAQALIFETEIRKDYNEAIYNKYRAKKVNQHSIGLQYVNLALAYNDEEAKEEFALWNKYINQIINKEAAEAAGYFWAVSEIKLMENSSVLFGSNSLTPTLQDSTKEQPPLGTVLQPQKSEVDWGKIANKFLQL